MPNARRKHGNTAPDQPRIAALLMKHGFDATLSFFCSLSVFTLD
jgi:hypothetical protein